MSHVTIGREHIALVGAELAKQAEGTPERKAKELKEERDRLESLSGADALEISRKDGWFYIGRADSEGAYARVPDSGTSTDELLHRPFHDFHEMIAARKRTIRAELEAHNRQQQP